MGPFAGAVRMRPPSFSVRWLGGLLGAALALGAVAPSWPGIVGEIHGRLETLPAAPALQWSLTVMPGENGLPKLAVRAEGEGTLMEAEIGLLPAAPDALRWRLKTVELDLARWSEALATQWPPLAGATLGGRVSVSGEGEWRDGRLSGRTLVRLSEGRVDVPAKKFTLEGLELAVQIDDLAARCTAPAQVFTLRGGHYDVVTLGAGRVVFALDGDKVQVAEAVLEALGGRLILAPFTVGLANPDITVAARAEQIDVTLLLPLLPPILAEAHGRLDGELAFHRDASGGIQIASGRLALRPEATAELRLLPSPGFLTGSLPPKVLQYYPGLIKIETGEMPMRADRLEVHLTPTGDAEGHSATVHLEGGPVDPALRAPLVFDLNVNGSLEAVAPLLMKFGADSKLRVGGAK
jgi:hypothetical protein